MTSHKLYRDLEVGDRFRSPRTEEGIVTVVCPPGCCTHDDRDRYSTHVFGYTEGGWRNEWFVVADPGSDDREVWAGNSVELA